ncbi:MAG: hypothetical protein ACI8XW_000663, partial [Gammaproteobacteria bacterium]
SELLRTLPGVLKTVSGHSRSIGCCSRHPSAFRLPSKVLATLRKSEPGH